MIPTAFGLALALAFLAAPLDGDAQTVPKIARVGLLRGEVSLERQSPFDQIFRQGLLDLGYIEGQNLVIEVRYASRERLAEVVAELARLKVDVIVAAGTPAALAAKAATTTIPIVVAPAADLVGSGLVASLARPGGNVTGITSLTTELSGKRLELLKEMLPGISRVGVLWNSANPGAVRSWHETQAAAKKIGLQLTSLEVTRPDEIRRAFEIARGAKLPAMLVVQDTFTLAHPKTIVQLAATHRMPSMYGSGGFVEAGGLISYGANRKEIFRRAAIFVDKILKGGRPGDLPVEQPTQFELNISLRTAKTLGLAIPPSLLQRADQVIQ
jgi:putative ABC transport system substrate-binding protein